MPELPEVAALAGFLDRHLSGSRLAAADLVAVSLLKTASPPLADLAGRSATGVRRRGKFLILGFGLEPGAEPDRFLVLHLARAGWVRLRSTVPASAARPGRGPLMLRLVFTSADGEPVGSLDVTEAGTRKSTAAYVVRDPQDVPGISRLGPDALDPALTESAFAALLAEHQPAQLKSLIRDQTVLAGVGNAYSDEILHAARLSPFARSDKLRPEQAAALYAALTQVLADAVAAAAALPPEQLKDSKRAGLRVHGRTGQPCAVCGTAIAEVAFADSSFQYCPGCQTGGRVLADRGLSRLLK